MNNRRRFILSMLSACTYLSTGYVISKAYGASRLVTPSPGMSYQRSRISGYRIPKEMKWGWGKSDDGILPTWVGGSGTQFSPDLIRWGDDGSATLFFEQHDDIWKAGELQIIRPKRPISERWGAIVSSSRPNAVCAIFAYAQDGSEIDFEWRGDEVWQLNLHFFDNEGNRVNPVPLPTFKIDITRVNRYEFFINSNECVWLVNGVEVAKVTPDDMKNAIWKHGAKFEMFLSVEHHGEWAKHKYTDLPANMIVHEILV